MGTTNDAVNLILRGEPFRNFCHSFYDDFVEQNVEFRHSAGVKSLIIRKNLGGSCDYCKNLAGIYVYGEEPKDVYRRHDSCRCLVTSKFEKGHYIDVWSKKEYNNQKEARIARVGEIEKELGRDERLHPRHPETGIKYKEHEIIIKNKSFGNKVRRHCKDFGLNPGKAEDREKLREKIHGIVTDADKRLYGDWRDQEYPVIFHIKGNDVVVENKYGVFITILRNGIVNERIAKRIR